MFPVLLILHLDQICFRLNPIEAINAGGAVTDLEGMPLQYGLQRPLLNPEFVAVGCVGLLALMHQPK